MKDTMYEATMTPKEEQRMAERDMAKEKTDRMAREMARTLGAYTTGREVKAIKRESRKGKR